MTAFTGITNGLGDVLKRGNLNQMPIIQSGRDGFFGNPAFYQDRLIPSGLVIRDYGRKAHVIASLTKRQIAEQLAEAKE